MTDTDYNAIADDYKASKLHPWRGYVERYTLMKLAGDVAGKAVIDLACGEGHYTRLLKRAGAQVIGVDASDGMIELARKQEQRNPLGIQYRVCDVRDLPDSNQYDLAFAAWLFNYAQDAAMLSAMCEAVARALKPGGRVVAINTDPNDPPNNYTADQGYGFYKTIKSESGELIEGAQVVWTVLLDDGKQIEIVNYHLERATVERCMNAAGLGNVQWHAPRLDPAAAQESGEEHWRYLLDNPPFVFIECQAAIPER